MKTASLPHNEQERLQALRRYEILDTVPEQDFDDITLLASHICGAPVAMISLVDDDRQWFKSKVGTTTTETPRDIAFCAHGILETDVFVVEDAQADERFADNPLVTEGSKIRFYAGSQLMTADGHALGMLCVNDRVPRKITPEQRAALQALARQVVAQLELRKSLKELRQNITERERAETELQKTHKQLMDVSRQAGRAEVATSVLHNVGNVLNSVNVSSSLIADKIRNSKVTNLTKVAGLLQAHENDLAGFFGGNPKGKQLPGYLADLASHLAQEQAEILREAGSLASNIMHIKEIVAMQQSYARAAGIMESLPVVDLVEDALQMNAAMMERHGVKVVRDFAEVPPILTEKHKVLQILVNLIRNAKYACGDSGREDKLVTLRVANGNERIKISVIDNGVGIPSENLTRIFSHG
ncbi:MAG: GAF domain-containing protein, partial [Verrucomicrobia bacterium]|nr:GAF domain-containing protein [Verrucomicrobiota bacterium]